MQIIKDYYSAVGIDMEIRTMDSESPWRRRAWYGQANRLIILRGSGWDFPQII
jgi:hypothetical protein